MANRVYVYSSNKIPSKGEGINKIKAKGIIEYNYDIPPSVHCLVGTKVIKEAPSIIWEEHNCFISDFKEGVKFFIDLFAVIINNNLYPNINKKMLYNNINFLTKNRGKFFITEFSEISVLNASDISKQNKILMKICQQKVKDYKQSLKPKMFSNYKPLKKHLNVKNEEELGFNQFSNVLYYS